MGYPMAQNLAKRYDLTVYDSCKEHTTGFENVAGSPLELFKEDHDVFITMLPNSKIVEAAYLDDTSGIIKNAKKGSMLIDCSTIHYTMARKLSQAAIQMGLSMVDAPVSGGVFGAKNATLALMVGGFTQVKEPENLRKILSSMGKKIFECGNAGNGQIAKACNNMLLGITMTGLSEALLLGEKLGLDSKILSDVINSSSGRCWSSETYNPAPGILGNSPASNNYNGGFSSLLIEKDLTLAIESAKTSDFIPPLGKSALGLFSDLNQDSEFRGKDFSIVYQYLKKISSQ